MKRKTRTPWYKRYPSDFRSRAAGLTLEGEAILQRLLDSFWIHGPIPLDAKEAAKRIGAPTKHAAVGRILDQLFTTTDSGYIDEDLAEYRVRVEAELAAKSAGGRKGADAKWRGGDDSAMTKPMAESVYARSDSESSSRGALGGSTDSRLGGGRRLAAEPVKAGAR